jgi:hypothetical protein
MAVGSVGLTGRSELIGSRRKFLSEKVNGYHQAENQEGDQQAGTEDGEEG